MATETFQHGRNTLALLAAATAIGALGLAAGGSAGALLAEDMTGSTAWAGVPLGALVVGSAMSALLIAWETSVAGRELGLVLGYVAGTAGALVVIAAAVIRDLPLLLLGSAALGGANAAIFLTRYAALDLGGENGRGRTLGVVLFATAFGAVASPNLLGPSGDAAEALNLPRLSGLYLVAVGAFLIAGLLLAAIPRRSLPSGTGQAVERGELHAGLRTAWLALFILGATNLVMVAVMAIAPIHLMEHDHSLDLVGIVIGIHVLCMFAPSPVTGWLSDRTDGSVVAGIGALFMVGAGVAGASTDMSDSTTMTAMLALLGLGWNAGIVGGTTLLAATTPAALRPQTEGVGEVAMGLAAGAGAPAAGLIVAFGDFTALSIAASIAGVVLFGALRISRRS